MIKKLVTILLACVLSFSMSTFAFADNEHGAEEHTLIIDVPAGDHNIQLPGISPQMWDNKNYGLESGYTLYTAWFTIPDPYFAFEVSATGAPSGSYSVALIYDTSTLLAAGSNYADGSTMKIDWISVFQNGSHHFKIVNNTGANIQIRLTYYSW